MKVLITGGAGYIGTELTYELAKNPKVKQIIIYDNLSRNNINLFIGKHKLSDKIKFVQGDILDTRLLKQNGSVSTCLHMPTDRLILYRRMLPKASRPNRSLANKTSVDGQLSRTF